MKCLSAHNWMAFIWGFGPTLFLFCHHPASPSGLAPFSQLSLQPGPWPGLPCHVPETCCHTSSWSCRSLWMAKASYRLFQARLRVYPPSLVISWCPVGVFILCFV